MEIQFIHCSHIVLLKAIADFRIGLGDLVTLKCTCKSMHTFINKFLKANPFPVIAYVEHALQSRCCYSDAMEFMHYSMKTFNWVLVGERLDQCVLNANFSSIGTYFWMLGKDPHGSSNGHLFVWSEVRRVLNYCLPQISASTSWVYRIDDYHVINISKKHLNNALCSNAIFKFDLRNRLKINDIGDYIQKTDMNCMIYWCPLKQQFRLHCYCPELIIKLRELAAYTRER